MPRFLYQVLKVNGTYILKSGSDFRQFSTISLDFRESPVGVEIDCVEVNKDMEADSELAKCLEQFKGIVEITYLIYQSVLSTVDFYLLY